MYYLVEKHFCEKPILSIRPYLPPSKSRLLIKELYYSGIGCQQQDVCNIRGYLETKKMLIYFKKQAQIKA